MTECRLDVDPEITWLIGASESGKSNLLEAMEKFETGGCTPKDVPRKLITGRAVDPDPELPIIAASYQLDQEDIKNLPSPPGELDSVTFHRTFQGPIEVISPHNLPGRPVESVLDDLAEIGDDLKEKVDSLVTRPV